MEVIPKGAHPGSSICIKDKLGISMGPAAKRKETCSNKMQ